MIAFTPVPYLRFGPWYISAHGLLIAAGFLVAVILAHRAAPRRGLSADIVDDAAIIAVLAGFVGARLVYIFVLGQGMGFIDALEVWKGGLSSHGGYIFGILAGLSYFKIKKVKVSEYADAVLPYLLIGFAIGRLGCFLNWDSYGKITSVAWAVVVNGEARHPTQLYESLGYLASFAIVKIFLPLPRPTLSYNRRGGSVAALSLGLFAAVRFVVDFWRDDTAQYLLLSRIVTVALIAGGAAYVAWTSRKKAIVV